MIHLSRILISSLLILSFIKLNSQTIPALRTVDWSKAGLATEQIDPSLTINFVTSGGIGNATTANDSVFNAIINSINSGDSAIIYFPNGNYLFNQSLNLASHIHIIGESSDSTILSFDLGGSGDLIRISGNASSDTAKITADLLKWSHSLTYNGSNLFSVGDFIQIIDTDTAITTSTWAVGTSGQIVRIDSINGNTIYVDKEIRRYYLLSNNPYIRKLNMIENNKIESLSILRLDSTSGQTSNINFNYAYNSKVSCIKSNFCNFSHIEVNYSSYIEIEGSYFQDSYGYGGGGRAYGVMLQFTTGDCFVYNNKFSHLRHSMILQAGANGNVFAYNFSINPFWTGTSFPADAAGDLVLHGNYVYANLFEGNSIQNLVIDNSHGINGPRNTFFRNRVNSYGIVMNSPNATDTVNFIGNEIPNTGFFRGNYLLAGNGHLEHGNNVRGTLTPPATSTLPDSSYYFSIPPSYYSSNSVWPPIGTPNVNNSNMTEAEAKYNQGMLTQCDSPLTTSIRSIHPIDDQIFIYPNPFKDNLYIKSEFKNRTVDIYSLTGKLIFHSNETPSKIDLSSLPNGMYILRLSNSSGNHVSKKLIKE